MNHEMRQAIALAGVFQAAQLVEDVAQRGLYEQQSFETSISSILVTDPQTVEEIYGGDLQQLKLGANMLRKALLKNAELPANVMRYAMSILLLQSKLQKNTAMLTALGQRLDAIHRQAQHFPVTHDNILSALSGLYQDTLSQFSFRIQVKGNPDLLRQQAYADKIRALLLAGVRSAMLWQQSGGKRWKLLFSRKRLLNQLNLLNL